MLYCWVDINMEWTNWCLSVHACKLEGWREVEIEGKRVQVADRYRDGGPLGGRFTETTF